MLFRRTSKRDPAGFDEALANIDLTDKGLTYFSRETFQNELERLGLSGRKGEWMTVAEMVQALEGTGLSVAVAVLPFDDVYDICDGRKRLVCLGPPSCEDGSEDGSDNGSDDA